MKPITVPDIGDFVDVPVIEILVAVGDVVAKDQALAVVESDKATMEIPSPEAGTVAAIETRVGEKVSKGSPLISLLVSDIEPAAVPQVPALPLAPPDMGQKPRDPGASEIDRTAAAQVTQFQVVAAPPAPEVAPRIYAGPAVRRMARDLGVSLQVVRGSGRQGRIVANDVRTHVKSTMRSLAVNATPDCDFHTLTASDVQLALPRLPKFDFAAFGPIEVQPLSRIRRIAAANLHRNWVTIPHVTSYEDADVTELEAFRTELNREGGRSVGKVSPVAFIMKACVAALKEYPQLNASLDRETLILKRYYHIGFAADTPNGLVVPVIRNCDQKGVLQLVKEMEEMVARARAGKLSAAETQGGSFSISSLGSIGGSYSTPIINAPEVAILGAGKIQTRAVWAAGSPQPRLVLPLSLSWDHRVLDGVAAARFNGYLARVLGDVRRLLL